MLKIFVLLLAIVVATKAVDPVTTQKLVKDLLKDYMKEVDPGTTNLTFGVSYMCADLSRYTLQLTSKVLEKYEWVDSRLKWDPSKYDGIQNIRLPANSIWTPDFKLYNTLNEPETRDDVNVVVMANGTIIWIPMVVYKTYCEPGRDKGDSIACLLHLGSWTYDANTLILQSSGLDIVSMYQDACPYVVTDPKADVESMVYPCCPEPYASMYVRFRIHHRL
jgi:nicotinic acetylcholine receptor alpha-6